MGIYAYDAYMIQCALQVGAPLLSLDWPLSFAGRREGGGRIKAADGQEFSVRPVSQARSPLDVPGVDLDLSADEIVQAVREGRARKHQQGHHPRPVRHQPNRQRFTSHCREYGADGVQRDPANDGEDDGKDNASFISTPNSHTSRPR